MNPIAFTPMTVYQTQISKSDGDIAKLPEEFLNEGEYMFYDVLDDDENQEQKTHKGFSRREIIESDLKRLPFKKYSSPNFDFMYLSGSDAEQNLEDIANKREYARTAICDFFLVHPKERHTLYIFSDDIESYCPTWGKTFASRALPEDMIAGIIFSEDKASYEQNNYGHELTHLLEFFFLPYMMRVPPYLREGMADYMSMSQTNKHLRYIKFLKAGLAENPFALNDKKLNNPEYMESASFIEYIGEVFGAGKLLDLYASSAVIQKGEQITLERFSEIINKILETPLNTIMSGYYSYICSLWNCENPSVNATTQNEIKEIFRRSEEYTKNEDMKKISELYSEDFYFRNPKQAEDLYIFHMIAMEDMKAEDFTFYPLDSWLYGESCAVKINFNKRGLKQSRIFTAEKLKGTWRLSPKYPGGIAAQN